MCGFEFDFFVAEDIRIGRSTGLILSEKIFKYVVPVLGGKVGLVQLDIQMMGNETREYIEIYARYFIAVFGPVDS